MLTLTHTIASAAIGDVINNPAGSFVFALAVHFVLDSFLHWNFYPGKHEPIFVLSAIEFLFGLVITFLILGTKIFSPPIFWAIIGGMLPDMWTIFRLIFHLKETPFDKIHSRVQRETPIVWKGLISQIIVVVISVYILLNYK